MEPYQILHILSLHPNGLSMEKLRQELASNLSQRTVQRHLKELIEQGTVLRSGQGPATVYQLTKPREATQNISADLPLSLEAKEVYELIDQPLAKRPAVDYNRAFLDAYLPNETTYLRESQVQKLLEISGGGDSRLKAGTFARQVMDRLLIDLSWNSSRLEGNTYSLLETERLLREGKSNDAKSALDAVMILNHREAIEYLVENAEDLDYSAFTVRNVHALLSDNLMGDLGACGRLRKIAVGIHGTSYRPLAIPGLIEECLLQILEKARAINDPFEAAFFLLVHIPYVQAFEDVNKRTSRLMANLPLLKANLCPLSFVDVPTDVYMRGLIGIYELNRIELLRDVFLWAYTRSAQRYATVQKQLGEPDPFRTRYRKEIRALVKEAVDSRMSRGEATVYIQKWVAQHLDVPGSPRLIAAVEQELLNLNRGNIARYKLKEPDFEQWRQVWDKSL